MTAPLVVFCVGNPSRGDDALGPILAERLRNWLVQAGAEAQIEVIEDFQLNIEHALDLRGRRLALFVDASLSCPAPLSFSAVLPASRLGVASHAMEPAEVLRVFMQTEGRMPPPAFILAIRGEAFALGEGLGQAATGHLAVAWDILLPLLQTLDPAVWAAREKDGLLLAPAI